MCKKHELEKRKYKDWLYRDMLQQENASSSLFFNVLPQYSVATSPLINLRMYNDMELTKG